MARRRQSGLEDLLELPFKNQKAAIIIAAVGIFLISQIPVNIIADLAPTTVLDPADAANVMNGIFARSFTGAAMSLTPLARIFGFTLLLFSGTALISRRKRWGYCSIIKDPNLSAAAGAFAIGIVAWAIMSQGLWFSQARMAAEAGNRITTGMATPSQTPVVPERLGNANRVVESPAQASALPRPTVPELPADRPFPANGTFERTIPLQGKIARMTFINRAPNNVIAVWYYNLNDGKGDKEALRLYVTAGQSAAIDISAFDYRMALYEAPPSLGLDRGFGPNAKLKDLGLVDLKTPATALAIQPSGTYSGYGIYTLRPGTLAARN